MSWLLLLILMTAWITGAVVYVALARYQTRSIPPWPPAPPAEEVDA